MADIHAQFSGGQSDPRGTWKIIEAVSSGFMPVRICSLMIVGSAEIPTEFRSSHGTAVSVHEVKSMQALGTLWITNSFISEIV
jgi:hypothetical protein